MRHFALILLAGLMVAGCRYADREADGKKKEKKATAKAESTTAGSEPAVEVPPGSERFSLPGFTVYEDDGRLWVFRTGSDALEGYAAKGDPAKRVTLVGEGPGGRTIMGAEKETLQSYMLAAEYGAPGYAVFGDDGRLWIFRDGSASLADFLAKGEPAKRVTLVGAGPDGRTIMGAERETLDAYALGARYAAPGYAVFGDDGRLWVFRKGGAALKEFAEKGEPAKRVTMVGAGPGGRTIMGAERETLQDYADGFRYASKGFAVFADDGRLWVFRENSDALAQFIEKGEPAKRVTMVGAGPDGRTIMGAERETLDAYAAPFKYGREGFTVFADDGRLWVFRKNSEALVQFTSKGEPAKRVTLVGAGPDGRTVMSADRETLNAYCAPYKYGREGFEVSMDDGRLWVFRTNSEAYHMFRTKGEPAKRVTLVGAGPDGLTVMGAERDTLDAYVTPYRYGKPGFEVFFDDGRLWVFRSGSDALKEYQWKGEPAKRVTLVGAGPDGRTVMGADRDTLEDYLKHFVQQ